MVDNTFFTSLKEKTNYIKTENGATAHKSTLNKVFDMFALGGSYRNRTDADVITLFSDALAENETLAMKCLFYLRDVRGGQGERRFFRVAYKWLCDNKKSVALRNLEQVSEYGRWDDLIYIAEGTKLQEEAFKIIKSQFQLDMESNVPSLLGKWLPSENASSHDTNRLGNKVRTFLGMTHKEYRQALSALRKKINIVERLMSENRWDEIEFDKIPSRAGLIYKNAFARRDLIAQKYKEFVKDDTKKVNAKALAPHEIAHQAFRSDGLALDDSNRLALQKYWDNLPNYYGNKQENGIAVVDVSGSMSGQPMEVAVALGAYIADKAKGPFANHFITFSERPQLVEFHGADITDKFNRCASADWVYNTDIEAVFDLLLRTARNRDVRPEDIPTRLYIFSDMEFDKGLNIDCGSRYHSRYWLGDDYSISKDTYNKTTTLIEDIAKKWSNYGYKLPEVVFWNLDARQNNIPAINGGTFSYVSGFNPVMIEQILSGVSGIDLMLAKLNSERYEKIV